MTTRTISALAAVVTPFTEDGLLDVAAARRAYAWMLEQGIDGFMAFGSMGEGPLLTPSMRKALAEASVDAAKGRGKLIFCLQGPSEAHLRAQMDELGGYAHDAWAVNLPSGMGRPVDPVKAFHRLADASDRPVFFYNLPTVTGIRLSLPQWRELVAHPRFAGIKNSAGTMRERKELQRLRDIHDFTLLEGDEWALDEALALGHDGFLVGMGLLGARMFKGLADAARAGDGTAARRWQMDIIGAFHVIYGEDVSTFCSGQKYALTRMRLFAADGGLRDDQHNLDDAIRARIGDYVAQHPEWFPVVG